MNVTINVEEFIHELTLLEKIASKKPVIAVLANVLIRANMGALILTTNNLEIALESACTGTIVEPGAITLPAKKLMGLLKATSADAFTLKSGPKSAVHCITGKFTSRLQTLEASDFPKIPEMPEEGQIALPHEIKELIRKVRYATSATETRYSLGGALMEIHVDSIAMVATDGARLSKATTVYDGPEHASIFISNKTLDVLALLLNKSTEQTNITFAVTDKHVFFELNGRLLVSCRIESQFPSYERIIPTANEHEAKINHISFRLMLKRFLHISDEVTLDFNDNNLIITAADSTVGGAREELDIEYTGPTITMKFRAGYLLDFLDVTSDDTITVNLKDDTSPALFQAEGLLNVIMGMI